MSANDVRKNFVFKKEVAEHLEKIAKREEKSMTAVLQEMIEEKYNEVSKEEKLEALQDYIELTKGMFEKGMTIQSIKANMDV